ncbi:MAG: class I SAM-dependent methyltransferase [Acidimicrobiales bacterium]|jgi:ubiquinone/menaquinone biosynthesis C-methylase UbiE
MQLEPEGTDPDQNRTTPGWMLDEMMHAGPEHLDANYVAAYDEMSRTDFEEVVDRLIGLGLGHESTVVDIGGGTGSFAIAAALVAGRVIAIDVSPAMVQLMRNRISALGIKNVEVVHAGVLSYQHAGDPPDFVHSRHTLHQIPDFWKVISLQKIHDLLRTGGILHPRDLFFSFTPDATEQVIGSGCGMHR